MNVFLRCLSVVAGVIGTFLTLYFGLWIMFVGGVVDIVGTCKNGLENVDAVTLALGLLKIVLTGASTLLGLFATYTVTALLWVAWSK